MDATYALLLIVFFLASNSITKTSKSPIVKLTATLSNIKTHPCQQPLQRGNCSQRISHFYYNSNDRKCRKFIYSGCNGNENRFANRRQCYAKCGRKLKVLTKQSSFTVCKQPFNSQYQKLCRQNTSTAPIWACKLQCARRKDLKLEKKPKILIVKKTVCFLKFDKNLRHGCETFDWRPRFFYNQTTSKCEMFWYDASCSKHSRKATNMFYHRGACKRLCEQSEQIQNNPKSSKRKGLHRIGQISAMFSQSYKSVKSNDNRFR